MPPYYNRIYTNAEIATMQTALLEQAQAITIELSWIRTMLEVEPADDRFGDAKIKDNLTRIGLAIQNMHAEMDLLWKRTRQ